VWCGFVNGLLEKVRIVRSFFGRTCPPTVFVVDGLVRELKHGDDQSSKPNGLLFALKTNET